MYLNIALIYVVNCLAYIGWITMMDELLVYLHRKGKLVKNDRAIVDITDSNIENFINGAVSVAPVVTYGYAISGRVEWNFTWSTVPIVLAYLLVHDAWFFLAHLAEHKNKWLFNVVHKHHHEPKSVNVRLVSHATVADILLIAGVPFYLWSYVSLNLLGDGAAWATGMYTACYLFLLSHCGYKPSLYLGLLCPSVAILSLVPLSSKVSDHLTHHVYPTKNMGAFFSIWDRLFGIHMNYRDLPKRRAIPRVVTKGDQTLSSKEEEDNKSTILADINITRPDYWTIVSIGLVSVVISVLVLSSVKSMLVALVTCATFLSVALTDFIADVSARDRDAIPKSVTRLLFRCASGVAGVAACWVAMASHIEL